MSSPTTNLDARPPAKKAVDVWRTDALMALAEEHSIELLALVPEMAERRQGKLPLGDSGYWIEFWTIEQGTSADGLYLKHTTDGGDDIQDMT